MGNVIFRYINHLGGIFSNRQIVRMVLRLLQSAMVSNYESKVLFQRCCIAFCEQVVRMILRLLRMLYGSVVHDSIN